jgi:hypothetical protein
MSITVTAIADFGPGKTGLTLSGAGAVSARLYDEDNNSVAGPYNPDRERGSSGIYEFGDVVIPATFDRGYWVVDPGDGSSAISIPVNLVDIGLVLSGAGERLVTLTVRDADTLEAIVGASVTVRSGSTGIRWGTTNASGQVVIGLPAGSYTALVTAGIAYAASTVYAFTVVAGSDYSANVDIEPQAASAPPAAGLCTLYGRYRLNGVAQTGATVRTRLISDFACTDEAVLSLQVDETTVDNDGYWELALVRKDEFLRGGKYRLEFWPLDAARPEMVREFWVPNKSTASFSEVV